VTIGEYVRRLRVEAAALRLAASNESISAIAHGTGFSDQSHLTRVFKQRMGVTPGRYRVAHGKPDSAAQGRPDSAAQGRPDSAAQGRRG
jgi:AraC-like DNA-binding protein